MQGSAAAVSFKHRPSILEVFLVCLLLADLVGSITESFLWRISTPSAHILGPAAAATEHQVATATDHPEDGNAEALELSGVHSALRLTMATDAGLRTAAVVALSAHLAGRAHPAEVQATLEDVLRACLARSQLSFMVMDVFSEVLSEVQTRLARENFIDSGNTAAFTGMVSYDSKAIAHDFVNILLGHACNNLTSKYSRALAMAQPYFLVQLSSVLLAPGIACLLAPFLEAFASLVLAMAGVSPAHSAGLPPPPAAAAAEKLQARMHVLCAEVALLTHQVLIQSSSQNAWAALPEAQPALQALFRALPGAWCVHLIPPGHSHAQIVHASL
eukprot:1146330-Pelagomonas_calceolata.AAC.4